MRLSHDPLRISASFDDPNLVSRGGLVPVMALAERAGLQALVRQHVAIAAKTGVYPEIKVGCLVAGMAAGADSIDDMDLLRHGAMPDLFGGVRAPSTLGSFLRSFTWGNVRQLEAAGRELLARQAPLLPGADVLAFVDVDSMQRRVYGHKKQGAAFGHTKIQGKTVLVRGLNALAATVCTPVAAPDPGPYTVFYPPSVAQAGNSTVIAVTGPDGLLLYSQDPGSGAWSQEEVAGADTSFTRPSIAQVGNSVVIASQGPSNSVWFWWKPIDSAQWTFEQVVFPS
jgi:hypothetical protein